MPRVAITGTGAEIPEGSVSNEELVASFNAWVDRENPKRIAAGKPPLDYSSSEFIEYASGVKARRMLDPEGVLDPDRMAPRFPERANDELSLMAEFGCKSARKALDEAGLSGEDIDFVICSASHQQRPYPAVAIEIQQELGCKGAGFDMNLACSSAGAAIHLAASLVRSGAQKRVLVITPEIISGHLNFRDRQTHFIFGDASVALVIEGLEEGEIRPGAFEILDTRVWTQMSSNIRSNFGFLNRASQERLDVVDMEGRLITQVGNKVFKEVTVAAHHFIREFLADNGNTPEDIRRYWLHQANGRMNAMILKLVLGHEADEDRAPMVLSWLGNTAGAGAVVSFDASKQGLKAGERGLFCAFGAGYSIGAALLEKM
ncbi:beta-ketoacyl-ACP synthase III [Zhengella mangrovi]|uniref:Beta-ketoacyl-ACP synthase III n=1 Tax=Zhengella mangrovi TaxID=1982044 RepID=A0A2G1QQ54_9HYPH|nr:beta-ketoacyl-ACP synthase III [Zhengella mangrovi]PHP67625.1 beta-ketoacyl-ACP synthase III [Zhengella mangrovi]